MRLIDADALVIATDEYFDNICAYDTLPSEAVSDAVSDIEHIIDSMPTIDAAPVRHSHWKGKPIAGCGNVKCSVCGMFYSENSGLWNYCPNCGAKMADDDNAQYEENIV